MKLFQAIILLPLVASPAFAGTPAPVVGGSVPGLVLLGAVGIGFAVLRYRRNRS